MNVVWFKRDLRTSDHVPLADAARHGSVLPLFIAEPELWQQPDLSGRPGQGHRAVARNIANKHGSRKRAGRQRTVVHRAMQTSLNFNGD